MPAQTTSRIHQFHSKRRRRNILYPLAFWPTKIPFSLQSKRFKELLYLNIFMFIHHRLFSAVYRPWNLYCVHLDSKSSPEFQAVIQKLLRCHSTYHGVDNIILMPPYNMVWQHSSLLEADLRLLLDWKTDDKKLLLLVPGALRSYYYITIAPGNIISTLLGLSTLW